MSSGESQAIGLVRIGMILGVGLGLTIFVLATLGTSLTGAANTAVQGVITAYTGTPLTVILPAVVSLLFIGLVAYAIKPLWHMFTGKNVGDKNVGGGSYD